MHVALCQCISPIRQGYEVCGWINIQIAAATLKAARWDCTGLGHFTLLTAHTADRLIGWPVGAHAGACEAVLAVGMKPPA